MLPHSYTLDHITKSQNLTSTILSSSSPSQISSACDSISSFLHSLHSDHSRHFFSLTFPSLICKLYGFDHSPSPSPPSPGAHSSWLDTVLYQNDAELASKLFNLLSPDSALFQSISAVDRLSLVKYVFPIERLPEWARYLFSSSHSSEKDLTNVCPLFKGKIKHDSSSHFQIQVNVFEYFMFWFAYYPVSKGNFDNSKDMSTNRRKAFKLETWANSICGFSSSHSLKRGDNGVNLECNLYLRLLYAYLCAFVPVHDLNTHQPYRSSLLHYGCGNDGSVMARAEFFVDTLVQYWLVDNDFSPLSLPVCKSFGLSLSGLRSVLGETPPTPNLGSVVKLLVKYLSMSLVVLVKEKGEHVESLKSRELVAAGINSMHEVGSWNEWIQRPLYRFLLRTFLFSPVGVQVNNVSKVFSVWVTYMQPWTIGLDDFKELDAIVNGRLKDGKKEDGKSEDSGYSSLWQGYVLSNYLYYSSLVMHFIGFAHKFLHTDPEVIVQMVLKVIKILTSSQPFIDLIKNVDSAFHSKQIGSDKVRSNSLYRHVPLINEQLQDWEDGLCETDVDGSFLHENWNKDLRLFSDGEDGGQQLLQLFILRAEAELQANSGDNVAINSLKVEISRLFGGHTVKPTSFLVEPRQREPCRGAIFNPRRVGNQTVADVKYKGDWMKRPVSGDEIAWLAKLLVWLSSWLNESLGLNQTEINEVGPKWSYLDVSSDVGNVYGPIETMKAVLCAIFSWFHMVAGALIGQMKKQSKSEPQSVGIKEDSDGSVCVCSIRHSEESFWAVAWSVDKDDETRIYRENEVQSW